MIRSANLHPRGLARMEGLIGAAGGAAVPPVIVGNSTTIPGMNETIVLASAADYGYDQIGRPFIVTPPGGLTVLSRTLHPATTAEGQPVNGAMKNPIRAESHGWDGRLTDYVSGQNDTFPMSVARGDILVCAIHEPIVGGDTRNGVVQRYNSFYFVETGWGANAIGPSVVGWPGRGTPQPVYVDCLAVAATFPSYDISALSPPTLASLQDKILREEVGFAKSWQRNNFTAGYQALTTRQATFGSSNYGQYQGIVQGLLGLYLASNGATVAQKAELLAWSIANGLALHDPAVAMSDILGSDGGQFQFHLIPVALALKNTGRNAALADLDNTMPGSYFDQTFVYTSDQVAQLAGHTNPEDAFIARHRDVISRTGNDVVFETDRTGLINTNDKAKMGIVGARMVRVSDGKSAIVLSQSSTNVAAGISTLTATIDAQPSPVFASSDVIFFQSQDPVQVGDIDWRIDPYDNAINPLVSASYRTGNQWSDDVLSARALDFWQAGWADFEAYAVRANRVDDPTPVRDYATHHATTFVEDFWSAHGPAILGEKPLFLTRPTITGVSKDGEVLTAVTGVMAGTTPITSAWQWAMDGVDVSGATSITYTCVTGDVGKVASVRQTATNADGSGTLASLGTVPIAAISTVNAVTFDGTNDWVYQTALTSPPAASKTGALVMTFRINSNWPNSPTIFNARRTSSSGAFQMTTNRNSSGGPPTDQGRLSINVKDTGGSNRGSLTFANATFLMDTWYTIAVSWDTATQTWVARVRAGGGSWVTPSFTGTPSLTLDALIAQANDYIIGALDPAGSGIVSEWDCYEVWYAPNQLPDFTDSAVLAKCVPLYDKGADGSGITGTAPLVYHFGATSTWHENKGSGGGGIEAGALTDAPTTPT